MDSGATLEKVWSSDEEQEIKDIKVRRSDLEDLARKCFIAQQWIFKLLLDHCPSGEEEEAAYTTLNTLSTLLGVVGEYKDWLSDLLDQLEDRRKRLECSFAEAGLLWANVDILWADGEKEVHDEDRNRSEGDLSTGGSDTTGVREDKEDTVQIRKEVVDGIEVFHF